MADSNTSHSPRNQAKNWKRHGSRFKARRRAVDILYEAEARDVDPVAIVQDRVHLSRIDESIVAPVAAYTREIIAGAAEELNRIDDVIASYLSEDWELHRISAVDRAILRVAVWEMIFNEDVPLKTAMTEAIEMAAQYSGATAPAYINAVLDSALKNIDELRSPTPELGDDIESDEDAESDSETATASDVEKLSDDGILALSFEEALAAAETSIVDAQDTDDDDTVHSETFIANEAVEEASAEEVMNDSETTSAVEATGNQLEETMSSSTEADLVDTENDASMQPPSNDVQPGVED